MGLLCASTPDLTNFTRFETRSLGTVPTQACGGSGSDHSHRNVVLQRAITSEVVFSILEMTLSLHRGIYTMG